MTMVDLPASVRDDLRDRLRRRSLAVFFPASVLCGAVVLTVSSFYGFALHVEALAFALLVIPLCLWGLWSRWPNISAWFTVVSFLGLGLVTARTFEPVGVFALIVPACLAWLLLGEAHGAVTAAALSAYLIIAPRLEYTDVTSRVAALLTLWFIQIVAWILMDHARQALSSAHEDYGKMRSLLEEARDQRLLLREAQQDSAHANSELSRVLNRLEAMRQVAEDARRTKEEFVANVSHELRTPLNMIIGFTEMIMDMPTAYGSDIPPALLADLDVIARNSQHLSSMIDDILDLSQIEAGRWALMKERVALPEIVEAAFVAVSPLFSSKGLYLTSDVEPNLPLVLCDLTRIREVLLNLLSNAGRATNSGGVHVCVWRDSDSIVTRVTDTGPGISPEHQEKIFRPFEQVDGSIRRLHGGSGLGLSISRAFVELHEGRMWLESSVGVGSSFYFSLPISPPSPLPGQVSRWFSPYLEYEPRQRKGRAHIGNPVPRYVVLEDEDALGRLLTRYMDDADIVHAASWSEALGELGKSPAQALLVNRLAPVEGLPAEHVSSLPFGTPAIICGFPPLHETIQSFGASDYLVKPISRANLLRALAHIEGRVQTVLIVDDEPEARRLFQRMLHSAEGDYRVLTASNGQEAVRLIRQDRPDAILLDLLMPTMDGYRLLEQRKSDPDLRSIPVIIISARDPSGQPIVSNAFSLVSGEGLSIAQLLSFIEYVSASMGPERRTARRELGESSSG